MDLSQQSADDASMIWRIWQYRSCWFPSAPVDAFVIDDANEVAIYLGHASFHDACHGDAFVNGVFRLSWSVSNGHCGWKDNWKRPFEVMPSRTLIP